jgi:hypothetical protein
MHRNASALHFSVTKFTDHFTGLQPKLRNRGPFLDAHNLHRHAELSQGLLERLSTQADIRAAAENTLVRPEEIEWRQGVRAWLRADRAFLG